MTKNGILYLVIVIPLALSVSYLFALAGAPQNVWFWCDVLKACP